MIVPDGSGGLRGLKNRYLYRKLFNQWIYGLDPLQRIVYDPYREQVIMPIYGIKAGSQALLGIVEQGQEAAKILATPAGVITSLNWITAEFWYSQSIIMRTSRQGSGIRIFDENPIPGDRSVRFYFLADANADYVGMAKAYRDYLMERQGVRRTSRQLSTAPLMIEFLGADYETNIFGPVIKPVTTEQAQQIVDELLAHGVDQLIIAERVEPMGIHGNYSAGYRSSRPWRQKALGHWRTICTNTVKLMLQDDYTRPWYNGFQPSTGQPDYI